jgi:hypothetical protein
MKHIYNFQNLKHKTLRWAIPIAIIPMFIVSCVKDGDFDFDKLANPTLDPTLAAPLVNSHLTLADILKDTSGIIQSDQDGLVTLVYETGDLISTKPSDFFQIQNQSINTDSTNINLPTSPSDTTYYLISSNYSFSMPKPGQRLDSIKIKSALLKLNITTNINKTCMLELTSPDITNSNGTPLKLKFNINYTGQPGTYSVPFTFDLSGYTMKLKNQPPKSNEILLQYSLKVIKNGLSVNNPYKIEMNDQIENIQFEKIFGYIGNYDFNFSDITELSIFYNNMLSNINISNVRFDVGILNSFGLPIKLIINQIKAYKSANPSQFQLINDIPNPITVNSPTVNQIGQSVTTPGLSNISSNDLASAINLGPDRISYSLKAVTNPNNNPSETNFVLENSALKINMKAIIPMYGKVNGFVVQDTLDFELKDLSNVSEMMVRVNAKNAFPIDARIQVYFTTNNPGLILDSLVTGDPLIIQSGIVGSAPALKVVTPTTKITDITLTPTQIARIRNAKKMIIKARINTSNNGISDVKIYNDNYIDVKLGVKTKLNVNL